MGNKNSCCVYSSPQVGRKEIGPETATRNLEEHLPEGGISVNNLQHISEREPEDWDSDPSLHPCAGTIFMERSKQAIESGYSGNCEKEKFNWNKTNALLTPLIFFFSFSPVLFRWHGEKKEPTSDSGHKAFEEE